MRSFVLALGVLALAVVGAAVTPGVLHGQEDAETIHVYKSPT